LIYEWRVTYPWPLLHLNVKKSEIAVMKITVLTDRPNKSHGNQNAAKKMIERILVEHPDCQINWIIQDPDAKPFNNPPFEENNNVQINVVKHWSKIEKEDIESYQTNLVYIFPEITVEEERKRSDDQAHIVSLLENISVPVSVCYQYDHHDPSEPYRAKYKTDYEVVSGLKKGTLGIFLEEEQSKSPLSDISKGGDSGVVHTLFSNQGAIQNIHEAEKQYFDKNNLFFCYYNTAETPLVINRVHYSILCILKSLSESPDKKIDIVVNMTSAEVKELRTKLEQITQHYGEDYPALKNFNISLIDKQDSEQLFNSQYTDGEQPGAKIRIINCFPMTSATFNHLLDASDNFVGLTGDQSFSEGLSRGKSILYQTVQWKRGLYEAYKEYVGEQDGMIYTKKLIDSSPAESVASLPFTVDKEVRTYLQSRFEKHIRPLLSILKESNKLSEESNIIKSKLLDEKNLYRSLPNLVYELAEKPLSTLLERGDIAAMRKFLKKNPSLITLESDENIISILKSLPDKEALSIEGSSNLLKFVVENEKTQLVDYLISTVDSQSHKSAIYYVLASSLILNKDSMFKHMLDNYVNDKNFLEVVLRTCKDKPQVIQKMSAENYDRLVLLVAKTESYSDVEDLKLIRNKSPNAQFLQFSKLPGKTEEMRESVATKKITLKETEKSKYDVKHPGVAKALKTKQAVEREAKRKPPKQR
jgi:hypothetical protein